MCHYWLDPSTRLAVDCALVCGGSRRAGGGPCAGSRQRHHQRPRAGSERRGDSRRDRRSHLVKTGATRTTVTDDRDVTASFNSNPASTSCGVSLAALRMQEKPGLTFVAGQNVQLDFTLFPQGVTVDPVVVTANDTPAVDTTRTVVGGTVTTHEVESLPVATRSPLDLIFTLPGVTEEALSTRDLAEDRNTSASQHSGRGRNVLALRRSGLFKQHHHRRSRQQRRPRRARTFSTFD